MSGQWVDSLHRSSPYAGVFRPFTTGNGVETYYFTTAFNSDAPITLTFLIFTEIFSNGS
jgi:hypothetical protein